MAGSGISSPRDGGLKPWNQKKKTPLAAKSTKNRQDRSDSSAGSSASSPREASPKPWKSKQKKPQAPAESIEIFEGKPTVAAGPLFESTPADGKGYIRILCKEEVEFLVPVKVVEQLKCVDVILHGEVEFKEKLENIIRFPDFRQEILESVLRFVFIEYLDALKAEKYWGENAPRVTFQFEVEPGEVMELVYAAHFFGIGNLLNVAASMIAHHFKDVPDVSSMPPDLAWCVAQQFSAQDLFCAEERPDFASLNLQTSSLWEKHCKNMLQDDAEIFIASPEHYPQYDKWSVSEGPPPTSWKSLFMSIYLQRLADRQDGGTNQDFYEEVAVKGGWPHTHTISRTIWEWVFTGPKSLSLSSYAAQFPNLLLLCLAKVPLGDNSLEVGKMLQLMQHLQLLDVSETGFTKDAAICLSESLQNHTRLQVLRAAYNRIATEGYVAIVRAVKSARVLKVLDVRENCIGYMIPADAVAAVKSSSLEELLLDGNCRCVSRLDFRSLPLVSAVPASLKCIQLQQCEFSDARLTVLANALNDHSAVEKIDLSDNKITSEGASALLLWLQTNTSLTELTFSHNNVTDACSTTLCVALQSHPSLEKFSLMGNYSYGEENLQEVIHAAANRGNVLLASKQRRFTLDLRSTDVSYGNRARIQRQAVHFNSLQLLI